MTNGDHRGYPLTTSIYIVSFIYNAIEYDNMIYIIVISHLSEIYHGCWFEKENCRIVPPLPKS